MTTYCHNINNFSIFYLWPNHEIIQNICESGAPVRTAATAPLPPILSAAASRAPAEFDQLKRALFPIRILRSPQSEKNGFRSGKTAK